MSQNRDMRDIPKMELKFKPQRTNLYLTTQELTIDFLRAVYRDEVNIQEVFTALYLDADFQIIGYKEIGRGNKHLSNIDLQLLLSCALLSRADKIIVCHNHPLTTVSASDADKNATYEILKACEAIEIPLIDHIIINQESSYLFLWEDKKFRELSLINKKRDEKNKEHKEV